MKCTKTNKQKKQQYNIQRIKGSATCFVRTEACAQMYCFSRALKLLKFILPLKRKIKYNSCK